MRKLIVALVLVAGCYKANIWLKAPPHQTTPSQAVHDRFEWSLFNVHQLSSPVDLASACAGEPDGIHEHVTVLGVVSNGLLSYFIPLLGTMNTTVLCSPGDAASAPVTERSHSPPESPAR